VIEAPATIEYPVLVVTDAEFPRNKVAELVASAKNVSESAGAEDTQAAAVVPTVVLNCITASGRPPKTPLIYFTSIFSVDI
jgi:hypothetical protein